MPALCSILNSAYYANSYAGIFDAGLRIKRKLSQYNARFDKREGNSHVQQL